MSQIDTTTWKKDSGFIWSMLGSAIGFANILRFSSQCYHNGGGAFLIPFVLAILVLGLPMLFMEGTIGHKMRLPIVSAFGKVAGKWGKTVGWLSIVAVATIGTFYIVLTGYSIAYCWFAGASLIPADTEGFFLNTFLADTGSLSQFGSFSIPVFVSMCVVCLFSWFVMARNIRSGVENVCSIFLPLLFALITFFAILVCFLPGAGIGFYHYLVPDFSKLSDPHLWRDVFGHVFFSFSIGLGIVTGYSRHTKSTTSIPKAMYYVALGDLAISVISGFAIFGCVGYISYVTGTPFSQTVGADSAFEMGFIVFPKILHLLGPIFSPIIGVAFFFSVFIAGVTGVFSIIDAIMGNIEFEFAKSRRAAATITTAILLGGATLFCFGNGSSIVSALTPMIFGNNALLGGTAEILIFMYVCKATKNDSIWTFAGRKRPAYLMLRYVVPPLLGLIFVASLQAEIQSGFGLAEVVRWGWFAGALAVSGLLARKETAKEALALAA